MSQGSPDRTGPSAPEGGLAGVPQEARGALLAHVGRLKHDLGKYVALRQRWVEPGASLDERRSALVDDVLSTRRGPDGCVDAATVWRELRPALVGEEPLPGGARIDLGADPDVRSIEAGMSVLEGVLSELRAGAVGATEVERGREAALRVSEGCRSLERRVRAGGG